MSTFLLSMIPGKFFSKLDYKGFWLGLFRMVLSTPFIYSVIIPVLILDIFISIYQGICFSLYGVPLVKRGRYIQFRRDMKALNIFEKLNCHYCSYVNGVIAYTQKIVGETERIWCPIKHLPKAKFEELHHQEDFVIRASKKDLDEYYKKYDEKSSKK